MEAPSTPVTMRFSNSTGLPQIPDNNPNASPHGVGVRFHLGERVHTDIVAHSTGRLSGPHGRRVSGIPAVRSPRPIRRWVSRRIFGAHPKALAFVQAPKPAPASFANEAYFGVTAARFTNADDLSHFGRYRILPEAGIENLSESAAAAKSENYLFDELKTRVASGPIGFRVAVQLAASGDVVDDATVHWPADRTVTEVGKITLTTPVANDAAEQQYIIFDPIPRVDGIEASEDPLLELRAAVYLLSGRRRRAAPATASAAGS